MGKYHHKGEALFEGDFLDYLMFFSSRYFMLNFLCLMANFYGHIDEQPISEETLKL